MVELCVLLLFIALLLVMFVGASRLQLDKDYFFLLFIVFALAYVFFAPTIVLLGGDETAVGVDENYPAIQAFISLLLLFPLVLAYRFISSMMGIKILARRDYEVSEVKMIWFCICLLAFEVLFVGLAIEEGMYSRRIGTEALAQLVSELDVGSLIVLRTHDLVVLPTIALLAVLIPSIKKQKNMHVYRLAMATLIAIVLSTAVFAMMNSRTLLIFLAMALLFASLVTRKTRRAISIRGFAMVALTILYGLIIISNIRNHGAGGGVADILNPVSIVTESDSAAFNRWEWTQRLDCVNLIAQMDNSLQQRGYEWGAAWERPLVAMFGPFVGSDLAVTYKAEARTTAKTYLMEEHTDIALKDYPSCMVTDLWGNFWIYGLPVAAMLVAIVFALLRYCLTLSLSPTAFVIALVLAFYVVAFEKEFVDWLFGWIKLVPAIVLLVLLNPIRKISVQNNSVAPL